MLLHSFVCIVWVCFPFADPCISSWTHFWSLLPLFWQGLFLLYWQTRLCRRESVGWGLRARSQRALGGCLRSRFTSRAEWGTNVKANEGLQLLLEAVEQFTLPFGQFFVRSTGHLRSCMLQCFSSPFFCANSHGFFVTVLFRTASNGSCLRHVQPSLLPAGNPLCLTMVDREISLVDVYVIGHMKFCHRTRHFWLQEKKQKNLAPNKSVLLGTSFPF